MPGWLAAETVVSSLSQGIGMTSQRTRDRLVQRLRADGIRDRAVLEAMGSTPRHLFVDEALASRAYEPTALPIGYGQTISQPYIVARMTELVVENLPARVLEVGTGSGYQAAVLAEITPQVYSIEIIEALHERAGRTLAENGYQSVRLRHGDGYYGWPEAAPFDGIIVTCAAGHIPPPLIEQLAVGGRMIIPVGKRFGTQHLILVTKNPDRTITSTNLMAVRFVPLVRQ